MDTEKVLLIFGLVLLLFFIMRNTSYNSVYTTSIPVTTKTYTITPQTNRVFVSPSHYNEYKAQYYN